MLSKFLLDSFFGQTCEKIYDSQSESVERNEITDVCYANPHI